MIDTGPIVGQVGDSSDAMSLWHRANFQNNSKAPILHLLQAKTRTQGLIDTIFTNIEADWAANPSKRLGRIHDDVASLVGRATSTIELVVNEKGRPHGSITSSNRHRTCHCDTRLSLRLLEKGKPSSCLSVHTFLRD